MMRAPITIPRLFCPPSQLPHTYLKHFQSCCMQRNKISVFQPQYRGQHLLQHLQNPTCQQLPRSFSAVTCPHKLFFSTFFHVLCSSSQALFLCFYLQIGDAPKIPDCATAAQHHSMQLFSHNSSLDALDPLLNYKILQQTNSDSCEKSHEM